MASFSVRVRVLVLAFLVAALVAPIASAFLLPLGGAGSSSGSRAVAAGAAASGGRAAVLGQQWQQQVDSRLATALWAKKNKESDVIEVDGIVKESLPNAKFRVELVATKAVIVCSTSGKMRKNFVRVLVGDPVKVELSPYDLTRGRITYRSRGGKSGDSSPPPPPPSS